MDEVLQKAQEKMASFSQLSITKIYFMGIKGVGMSALALVAKDAGFEVAGCDVNEEFITDAALHQKSILINDHFNSDDFVNFIANTPTKEVLLVITGAHGGFDNPVSKKAKEMGISIITQGQAVGVFMNGAFLKRNTFRGVSVCGSHGKTTISALCATVLHALGVDPSYIVGTGEVFPIGLPGHLGLGDIFIAEADEYVSEIHYDKTPKLYYQNPEYVILNNIDFDHPDFFKDITEIKNMFLKFLNGTSRDVKLFVNGDDAYIQEILPSLQNKKIYTYGVAPTNTFFLSDFQQYVDHSVFDVWKAEQKIGQFSLKIPGIHNAQNSIAVIGLCYELGFTPEKIADALIQYAGSKRRAEIIGATQNGAVIIDDYAHHPKEISTTLSSLQAAFQGRKLVCIFQPHTYSRTMSLLDDFAQAISIADEVILLPVFASAREKSEEDTVSEKLVEETKKIHPGSHFFSSADDVIEYVTKNFDSPEYVLITMGAGDVYNISQKVKVKSQN